MKKFQLSSRASDILDFIRANNTTTNQQIKEFISQKYGDVSRITITRDLLDLLNLKLIKKIGTGKYTHYVDIELNVLLKYFDVERYFSNENITRENKKYQFNHKIYAYLTKDNIFSATEKKELGRINEAYRERLKQLTPGIIKKEIERLTIELSWKSSQIEGNTYSLIDTEVLIKHHQPSAKNSPQETQMILNHKTAIDYIFQHINEYKKINLKQIIELHQLLTEKQEIRPDLRNKAVGIVGTNFSPIDNQYQIREAMEKTIKIINKFENAFSKAVGLILMISYIQPFEDGNKRTARIMGNAVLLANDICPLSYRSVEEADYKKAMILFYEQNSSVFFKELFIKQFRYATSNYFLK